MVGPRQKDALVRTLHVRRPASGRRGRGLRALSLAAAGLIAVTCAPQPGGGPVPTGTTAEPPVAAIDFDPASFPSENGPAVDGELGFLTVPEDHDVTDGPTIALAVAHLAARGGSGSPIVYLSGGPGAWGIHPERMPLLDALRDYGDVYTFDQRGTGRSTPMLDCPEQASLPPGSSGRDELLEMYMGQARECAAHWRAQGVNLAAYNTLMSARDLDAIRQALGADKLRLVSASYGSHLSLAYIRNFEDHVDRAVLALIEGPDHTIKLPADLDTHLQKISNMIAAHPVGGPLLPDFHGLAVELIAQLEAEPMPMVSEGANGPETYMLTARDMRQIVAGMIGRRFSIQFIVEDFAPLAAGDFTHMARIFPGFRTTRENAMRAVIDCASGVSATRRRLIAEQAENSLLGTATDFPYPDVCEAWGINDLGDDFRAPVQSSVPALFVSGDLDGRTPISNAEEVMEGFPNSTHMIVGGVGHEGFVFFASPELIPLIGEFFAGAMPAGRHLEGPELEFTLPAR